MPSLLTIGRHNKMNSIISFEADAIGISFEKIDIYDPDRDVEKISLEAKVGKILINVYVMGKELIGDYNDKSYLIEKINVLLSRIAYEHNVIVGEPYFKGAIIPKEDRSGATVIVEQIFVYNIIEGEKVLGEDSRRNLQQSLERPQDNADQYLLSFRFAVRQQNDIARYSLLYNLLLAIFGDDQKSVDQFIEREEPNIIKTPRPDKPSVL